MRGHPPLAAAPSEQADLRPQPTPRAAGVGGPVVHTCFRCGSVDAAWGFGVDVPKGSAGLWACRAHKAEAEAAVQAEQLARVERARVAMVPAQGNLL